jgi:hypothetical protein
VAQFPAAQFIAHYSPRTIHRTQFIVAQFIAHNSLQKNKNVA